MTEQQFPEIGSPDSWLAGSCIYRERERERDRGVVKAKRMMHTDWQSADKYRR